MAIIRTWLPVLTYNKYEETNNFPSGKLLLTTVVIATRKTMQNLTVTFDSNVWENIVDESKRNNKQVYKDIYNLITQKKIIPYFFEGIATTETILKTDRKDYFKNYRTTITFQVKGEKASVSEGIKAPKLTHYLKKNIPKALKIGFKFIKLPRSGSISLNIDEKYIAVDKNYSLKDRLDRSFKCARYIEILGAGKKQLENKLDGSSNKGIINQTKNDLSTNRKQYAKGIAEWVDGDALSAHYGYDIDYFCTNDTAVGAGTSSVFSKNNLQKIKNKFNINIVSASELIEILEEIV